MVTFSTRDTRLERKTDDRTSLAIWALEHFELHSNQLESNKHSKAFRLVNVQAFYYPLTRESSCGAMGYVSGSRKTTVREVQRKLVPQRTEAIQNTSNTQCQSKS